MHRDFCCPESRELTREPALGDSIVHYLVPLPLNTILAVGTVLFLLYNGDNGGPGVLPTEGILEISAGSAMGNLLPSDVP